MSNQRACKKKMMRFGKIDRKKFIKVGHEKREVSSVGDYKFRAAITKE